LLRPKGINMGTIHDDPDPPQATVKRTRPLADEQDQIRGFYSSALRAVTGYNYLTRKWLPLKGPSFYALVNVLRSHCYFDPRTGEQRDTCFPEAETLARECGLSRRTIFYLLKDPEMGRFVKRIHRRRYSPEHEREVQTSNLYLVSLDDPTVPADDHLVAEKEAELQALAALADQTERTDKTTGRGTKDRSTTRCEHGRRPSECKFCTLNAVQLLHSQQGANSAHEIETLNESSLKEGVRRSPGAESFPVARMTIGTRQQDTATTEPQPGRHQGDGHTPPSDQIASPPQSSSGQTPTQGVGVALQGDALLQEDEARLAHVDAIAGNLLYDLFSAHAAAAPENGIRTIVKALVQAQVPDGVISPLIYLARDRMYWRAGGEPVGNWAGYFIEVTRNLITEASQSRLGRKAWNIAAIRARDEQKQRRKRESSHS
jgi:hypothetical protein